MITGKQMTADNGLTGRVQNLLKVARVNIFRGADGFFKPVLGPLMQNRRVIALLGTLAVLQIGLTAAKVTAWQCPLKSALGIICPGCGLTRAVLLIIQGRWLAALQVHAFAPIVLAGGILLAAGSALPARLQQKLAARITDFERRTGIAALLILSSLIYWILRIGHSI
jgi:Protein of unknown function (DUF2752)